MRSKFREFLRKLAICFRRQLDPEIQELVQEMEALENYLRIQNLRRLEETRFRRLAEMR